MLQPYNVKIKVFCKDDAEAHKVQQAINSASSEFNIIGEDLIGFYAKYQKNAHILNPILSDVFKRGVSAISKHLFTLAKLK